jgi:hypothetical protein
MIAHLTILITEAPWQLTPADRAAAHEVGLADEALVHLVMLSASFGHLNRMADAVGIELDYQVAQLPPAAEPATLPYLYPATAEWPKPAVPPALTPALRPQSAAALLAWREHSLTRAAPLLPRQRHLIARAVAARLGDAATLQALTGAAESTLDEALIAAADQVTLAPFALGAETVARLRSAGLASAEAVFDAIATASSSTAYSRIAVALAALSG